MELETKGYRGSAGNSEKIYGALRSAGFELVFTQGIDLLKGNIRKASSSYDIGTIHGPEVNVNGLNLEGVRGDEARELDSILSELD
ncbi:MAG: hypothetical protein KC506_00560, partial [Nanoarchaeota archaeon]|nr:hypothetical protein [Nanoarchaeota archaeon]